MKRRLAHSQHFKVTWVKNFKYEEYQTILNKPMEDNKNGMKKWPTSFTLCFCLLWRWLLLRSFSLFWRVKGRCKVNGEDCKLRKIVLLTSHLLWPVTLFVPLWTVRCFMFTIRRTFTSEVKKWTKCYDKARLIHLLNHQHVLLQVFEIRNICNMQND